VGVVALSHACTVIVSPVLSVTFTENVLNSPQPSASMLTLAFSRRGVLLILNASLVVFVPLLWNPLPATIVTL